MGDVESLGSQKCLYKTWPPPAGGKSPTKFQVDERIGCSLSASDILICDKAEPVSLSEALASISLTYSPTTKRLHKVPADTQSAHSLDCGERIAKCGEDFQDEEPVKEAGGEPASSLPPPPPAPEPPRYVLGHRKAFSLPRTLEIVNEDGTISHVPQVEPESPRSTLLRYGHVREPFQLDRESAISSMSSLSSRTDFSLYGPNSETSSSHGDSGILSAHHAPTSTRSCTAAAKVLLEHQQQQQQQQQQQASRKGLTEFFSKGLTANWKLLSKSSQQVAKLMHRPRSESGRSEAVVGSCSSVASSQSLIMEDRPPGLPAKHTEEKERHHLEFQSILESMKRREKEEKVERAKRQAEQRRLEDDMSAAATLWSSQVLPNWSSCWQSKKTQALWWKGLPPPVRGRVWKLALQNQLNLTPQLYSILVDRAKALISSWQEGGAKGTEGSQPPPTAISSRSSMRRSPSLSREETLELIALDVSRTFPQLCIFQKGGPYFNLLHNVLGAYVCYRPDLGYIQGMSFIAAILILNLDEADAFILFANLVNRPLLSAFFTLDQPLMEGYYASFSSLLSAHLPLIADHLSGVGLRPELYLLDWIMTLFGKAAPLDLACRIWDVMFRDGQEFLFRAALGILSMYQDEILAEPDFIEIARFLAKLPENINADSLFREIESLNLVAKLKTFTNVFAK